MIVRSLYIIEDHMPTPTSEQKEATVLIYAALKLQTNGEHCYAAWKEAADYMSQNAIDSVAVTFQGERKTYTKAYVLWQEKQISEIYEAAIRDKKTDNLRAAKNLLEGVMPLFVNTAFESIRSLMWLAVFRLLAQLEPNTPQGLADSSVNVREPETLRELNGSPVSFAAG